jgi:hypothetical protein
MDRVRKRFFMLPFPGVCPYHQKSDFLISGLMILFSNT